jgi:hypothetical protein
VKSSILGFETRALSFLLALVPFGCGGAEPSEVAEEIRNALVITNCTGPAISAAVAAGGDVVLDCGPTPVTISVPLTNVTLPVRLRTLVPGNVTLTHSAGLFRVTNNASLQLENLRFIGPGGLAAHILAGSATVINSTFSGYSLFALSVHTPASRLTVSRSLFAFNGTPSTGFAAAIYAEGAPVQVSDSTFVINQANSGGAITSLGGGPLTVSGCTFADNVAGMGGAIYASGGANSITNSTFTRNRASTGGAVQAGPFGSFTIRNSTFADNPAQSGMIAGNAQLFNSILLDQVSPGTATCTLGGSGNIQWPTTRPLCGLGYRHANPLLGPLANNGGSTQTMALNLGSGAIDTAVGLCPGIDQRGVFRPRDGDGNGSAICDVGAFER